MIEKGFNIYSQFGEDGILLHLIDILGLSNKQSCELGMNGLIYSNTYNLVKNHGWYGVFIEKNNLTLPNIQNCEIINTEVIPIGKNGLDYILKRTILNKNFDILSIDVDGIDYHIWENLNEYTPNIVIIEINPFFDPYTEYINNGTYFSSSFKSTVDLGFKKGYTLVCMTGNLIFVKTEKLYNTTLEYFINYDPNILFLDDAFMLTKNEISFKRYLKKDKLI